jgi:tetratricopeptide (TPR) repeat protein
MRQVVQTGFITPADELRELLTLSEKRVANLRGSGTAALDLLRHMDRVATLWPQLEANGLDLKPEAGRWSTIQAGLRRQAPIVLKELAAFGGAATVRQREHPAGTENWWWHLDKEVRERNRRQLARTGLTLSIVAVAGVGIWLLLRILLPVDPVLRETMRALDAGDALVQQEGDAAGALVQYRRAAESNPQDSETWLRIGAVLEMQGDAPGAAEAFEHAETIIGDPARYRLARGGAYFVLGMLEQAERELLTAIDLKPTDPYAYYYLASVHEQRGQGAEAIAALEKTAQYAEEQGEAQLIAMARFRMGMIMQAQQGFQPTVTPAP